MTEAEKEETLARIEAAEKELAELKAKVQSGNEVPDEYDDIDKPLKIEGDEQIYYVNEAGEINIAFGTSSHVPFYNARRRAFKQLKYAEMYREKTQFIADLLHFKWLYDRDFEPDWGNEGEKKYTVWYDHRNNIYRIDNTETWENMAIVNFSTWELAKKCADWLNRKAGKI